MNRIVSLIPSATEIVCALGLGDSLVGRSHECDYPPWVARLPALTEPKLALAGSSREIDERVKSVLEAALSVYRVDADRLRALRPDVIVTQSQCEVCAVSLPDVERALESWLDGARPALISLEATSLKGVMADIGRAGAALGAGSAAERLIAGLKRRMEAIEAAAQKAASRPSVATIEWIEPLMAGGNWMPEIVAMAGGTNLFGEAGSHSPRIEFDRLLAADPEVMIVAPCGFDIQRTMSELSHLRGRPGFAQLRAARQGRVYVADGNQFFNRPGPRLVESLEIMAEILHPNSFRFGHRGNGWICAPASSGA